jgi:hypothetical protein
MPVSYSVDDTSNEAEDSDADSLNPVVVATEKSWQALLAPHTPMSAQFLPAVGRSRHERATRHMVAQRISGRN